MKQKNVKNQKQKKRRTPTKEVILKIKKKTLTKEQQKESTEKM